MEPTIEQIARKEVRSILEVTGLGYLEKDNFDTEHEYFTDLFKEAQEILDSKFLELKNSMYFVKSFEDGYENQYELVHILEDYYKPKMHFTYKVKMGNKLLYVSFIIEFSFELSNQEKFIKNLRGSVEYDTYELKILDVN